MTPSRGVALTPDLLQGLFEAVDNTLAPGPRPVDLLAVANAAHPIRFEGWKPWLQDGPGHRPPSAEEAATTVRVKPPPSQDGDFQ